MSNLEKIKQGLKTAGFDAVLLLSPENRRYAAGFSSSAGAVLVYRGGAALITDFRYIEAAQKTDGFDVYMNDGKTTVISIVNEIIRKKGIKTVSFEENEMTVKQHQKYENELYAKLVFENGLLASLRETKDPPEVEMIRKAVRIADLAFSDVLPIIKEGMTERELSAELQYRMLRRGADGMSFDPIVVSGVRSSMPHGTPSDKKLFAGEFITMDFGCVKDGYCSDMTRTVALSYATDEMKRVYDIVLSAQLSAIGKAKAGEAAKDVDLAARCKIEAEGFGQCFGHGTGHGVGLLVHEAPTVSYASPEMLKAGNVISAEPGIYIAGKFGVRIEDLLHITNDGCEILTKSPKELLILR